MINFLKAISRVTLTNNEKEILINFLENDYMYPNYTEVLLKNRIQFLFFKHIMEQKQIDLLDNKLGLDYTAQLYFNKLLYNEYIDVIEEVISEFNRNNIHYCIIKGFSIIDSLYNVNQLIFRRFSDVDFLISKCDVDKVKCILEALEFVQGKINTMGEIEKASRKDILYWSLNSHQEHTFIKFSKYAISPFVKINIDINTSIFEGGTIPDPISTEELLNHRQVKKNSRGGDFYTLDYTYEFMQLCYHFYKDTVYEAKIQRKENYTLYKFCDIREYFIKYKSEIDWNLFISIINQHELGNMIYRVLYTVSNFYGDLDIDDIINQIKITQNIELPNWEKSLLI